MFLYNLNHINDRRLIVEVVHRITVSGVTLMRPYPHNPPIIVGKMMPVAILAPMCPSPLYPTLIVVVVEKMFPLPLNTTINVT